VIRVVLANFSWQRKAWRAILKRVQPERVLVADFGEYGLVAAATEKGIPTFELQHGIADRHHPAYAWSDHALPHRKQMPIAQRFLVYGEYWRRELSQSGFWGGSIDVVGSTRIDRHRSIARTSGSGPYRLLVAADGIESLATIRIVREMLAVFGADDVQVTIKLHPVYTALDEEMRTAFSGDKRVAVYAAAEGDSTFRILRGVDLHASVGSASHYDALGLGTPTAIIAAGNYRMVLHLRDHGHASVVSTGEELAAALIQARASGLPAYASDFYFREGALQNVLAVLDEDTQSRSNRLL
jgi:hypothetical protein